MVVTLGQQYHVGEKPTVIMYTCFDRHAGKQTKTKHKQYCTSLNRLVIVYDNNAIEPYSKLWGLK